MMRLCLSILEASIRERPGQWLWQHNRWKQQTVGKIKRRFRHNTLCVLMPDSREEFNSLLPLLATIRELYPRELLTLLIPHAFAETPLPYDAEIIYYHTPEQLLLDDLRFKLIFNFANHPGARRHYLGLSGFEVLTLAQLKKLAGPAPTLSETLIKAVSDAR